ncbi:unnamed protein product [Rotaria socialis]|uniref:Uncharacterized protein n=1 Tax=Rotaria socialis TaxID=392032 RepID=A0A818F9J0_9BILA|nr:unnamed protein product [Rotaria socialis]CAF3470607.1 unnamed protein product [Rotaria socialis]
MTTTSQTSDSLYSKESFSNDFIDLDDWLVSLKNGEASSTSTYNTKLNAEIHLAITAEPAEYASSLCDNLFILYRDVQYRSFVLQFLPSFITTYYDVLHRHPESTDVTAKDVCSTIDTFLIALYNLSVLDDAHHEKIHGFRIPNLTAPSIYHTPNPDYYAPTPLTQHAISKHEKKCDVVRLHSFSPFDSVNATTREHILWFLLIQYGSNVSNVDIYSRHSYFKMSKKLLSQGFSFGESISTQEKNSILPPNGRRIHLSSRVIAELLGAIFYFKANSSDREASECMRLLKQRAEYEMYADVILMTESMSYLHEFDNHQLEHQDTIGIEIELPPTMDMVKQKRTATTTRSMKNRQRSTKRYQQNETAIIENDLPNDTIEHLNVAPVRTDATPTAVIPATTTTTSQLHKSLLDIFDESSPTDKFLRSIDRKTSSLSSSSSEQHHERKASDDNQDVTTPLIDEMKTYISSSIGLAGSSSSPSSTRHYKPMSLTSTQAYFKTIQQQQRVSSPNIQNVQTMLHHVDNDDSIRPHTSSMRHGEKKDIITTVRFLGTDQNGDNVKETFL